MNRDRKFEFKLVADDNGVIITESTKFYPLHKTVKGEWRKDTVYISYAELDRITKARREATRNEAGK